MSSLSRSKHKLLLTKIVQEHTPDNEGGGYHKADARLEISLSI